MNINSKIEDFETMITGLQKYNSSLQEHCQTLKQAAEVYDTGVNDRSSHVYRKKIEKLCSQINPTTTEKVDILIKNLKEQLEQLKLIAAQVNAEENE